MVEAPVSLETVAVERPDEVYVIIGQAHFINAADDLHEALVDLSPHVRFGVGFCEASGAGLVRRSGNDDDLVRIAAANAQAIGAGRSFVVLLRERSTVNVVNQANAVAKICTVFCASANPVDVLVATTEHGRGVVGVIDGTPPVGAEDGENRAVAQVLSKAAEDAGLAPSILNTQPWRWRVRDGVLELYADRTRQVTSIDPEGRLMRLSCGAALHHARVALAGAGHEPAVVRYPDPDSPDLLAQVRVGGVHSVQREDVSNRQSMRRRRSDRRPFPATVPVPADAIAALQATAEAEHAWLHRIGPDQIMFLTAAAERAGTTEAKDERYLEDLRAWTRRSRATGEGVTPETILAPVPRPVPLRDFAPDGETLLHPDVGDDRFADYLILATEDDGPTDWLRAGEATSAVWLTATSLGLAVSAMSDVVEVPGARALLRSLLHGRGHPQLVLRVGFDMQQVPPPASPRRRAGDVIDTGPPT
jgi:adenosine/AMP kinase